MKTNIIIFSSILILVLFSSNPVNTTAQENSYNNDLNNINNLDSNREDKKIEIQENFDNRKSNLMEKLQNKRQEIAQNHSERLEKRFNIYFEKLSGLIEKLQSKYILMSENGKDMSDAIAKLNEANSTLTEAKSLGDQAIQKFQTIPNEDTDTQKEMIKEAKDLANQARVKFKDTLSLTKESVMIAKNIKKVN